VNWQDLIERRPDVMMAKPVFKGTRLTVETVLQRLGDGWSEKELLDAHPRLTADHIKAACAFGAAEKASAIETEAYLKKRMTRPTREEFEEALRHIPSRPPLPGDEIK
jgi:uncharacterized protein (DUF433 family)